VEVESTVSSWDILVSEVMMDCFEPCDNTGRDFKVAGTDRQIG